MRFSIATPTVMGAASVGRAVRTAPASPAMCHVQANVFRRKSIVHIIEGEVLFVHDRG